MVGVMTRSGGNRRRLTSLALLLVYVFCLVVPLVSFADDTVTISIPEEDSAAFEKVMSALGDANTLKASDGGTTSQFASYSGGSLTFNIEAFNKADSKTRKASVAKFVKELMKSGVSVKTQNDITTRLGDAHSSINLIMAPLILDDARADIYWGYKALSWLLWVVRAAMGVIAVAATVFIVFGTVVDLIAMSSSNFREMFSNNDKEYGRGDGPKWVSGAAKRAIQMSTASLSGAYKSPYGIYFKARVWDYIWFVVCLIYLAAGELGGLMAKLIDFLTGLTLG